MADPVVDSNVAPVVQPPAGDDLIKRASEVKIETPLPAKADVDYENHFDPNAINTLKTSEELKSYAEGLRKSYARGFEKKTQELSSTRKLLEAQLTSMNTWTPERVQALINDPQFVQAASSIIGPSSQNDNSMLSENERKTISNIERQQQTILKQQLELQKREQDVQIAGRFSNYNPQSVDILTAELIEGKVQATREHLWKVLDYDQAVQRAYELGKQDRNLSIKEKINASSATGFNASPITSGSEIDPKESSSQAWERSKQNALNALAQAAKK